MNPTPELPVPLCRSMTSIFNKSRETSATAAPPASVGFISRCSVICAEADAPRVGRRDHRKQRVEVACIGRLADQQVKAPTQLFPRLGRRDALMIATDTGGGVGVEALAGHARAVPVHRAAAHRRE